MTTVRRLGRWLVLPVASYLLLLVDWRGSSDPSAPIVHRAFEVSGPLSAGAARVRLSPPLPVVRAGYGIRRAVADRERDPLEVRAVVLRAGQRRIAIVLLDLVLVPEALVRALDSRLADVGLDGLMVVATHTHSSVGGFDGRWVAQLAGTGRYRADVVAHLLDRAEAAVRQARQRLVPVQARTADARLPAWAQNRSTAGAAVDDALTVAELVSHDTSRVAILAIVAAHPTLLPRADTELSADYPGAAMRHLEADGGIAFVLQGAQGDARPPGFGAEAVERAGAFVAEKVIETLGGATVTPGRLAFAEVEVATPPAELQRARSFFVRRPASNVLEWLTPATARLAVVSVGDLMLLAIPGEPTALAAARMVTALPQAALRGRRVRVVAVAQDYLGYIETPERVRAGQGEGRRAWFAPELLDTVTRGLQAAVSTQHGGT